jgi:hypothetical protein
MIRKLCGFFCNKIFIYLIFCYVDFGVERHCLPYFREYFLPTTNITTTTMSNNKKQQKAIISKAATTSVDETPSIERSARPSSSRARIEPSSIAAQLSNDNVVLKNTSKQQQQQQRVVPTQNTQLSSSSVNDSVDDQFEDMPAGAVATAMRNASLNPNGLCSFFQLFI